MIRSKPRNRLDLPGIGIYLKLPTVKMKRKKVLKVDKTRCSSTWKGLRSIWKLRLV